MNIAIIGSGGREHALAYAIKKSPDCDNLYILPGNAGTDALGENIHIAASDFDQVAAFCKEKQIQFVVIGPEQPLVDGLAKHLRKNGLVVFGPDPEAAMLEADKAFAKSIMSKMNVPTADYKEFTTSEYEDAKNYLETHTYPVVIKANGLAAGKGVAICETKEDALEALEKTMINKAFGQAGDKVVIEDFLVGEEASVFAVTDGTDYYCLPPAQDHKRIGDGDTGPNTGGMGAYAPAPVVTDDILKRVANEIIEPTLKGMQEAGKPFSGCLYCGLMITNEGPKVVEFNVRFGDPETQVVLPIVDGDLLKLLYTAAKGNIDKTSVTYSGKTSVCVVAASEGYPGKYEKGKEIKGLSDSNDSELTVFQAGTKKDADKIVTSGGRVLAVTSIINDQNIKKAIDKAYEGMDKICFEGIYFRKDIGHRAL